MKSVIRLGNNEVLKTLTKTLIFVDANANADAAEGSTIALCERCSDELKNNMAFTGLYMCRKLTRKKCTKYHQYISNKF